MLARKKKLIDFGNSKIIEIIPVCKNILAIAQLRVFITTLISGCNADLIQLQGRGGVCTPSAESLAKVLAIKIHATGTIAERTERNLSW